MTVDYLSKVSEILEDASSLLYDNNYVNGCVSKIERSCEILKGASRFVRSNNKTYGEAFDVHFDKVDMMLSYINYTVGAFLIPRGIEGALKNPHKIDFN